MYICIACHTNQTLHLMQFWSRFIYFTIENRIIFCIPFVGDLYIDSNRINGIDQPPFIPFWYQWLVFTNVQLLAMPVKFQTVHLSKAQH